MAEHAKENAIIVNDLLEDQHGILLKGYLNMTFFCDKLKLLFSVKAHYNMDSDIRHL